ncbi:MAG: hypothetical protein N2322_06615 [Terrimicrobiaceae bacterium]|nr:hypothetical protein [Terrimicrobiaceae bacterium]
MPIYEFYSPDTNKIYSFFARSLSMAEKTPRCPDRPGARMQRLVSKFAVTGRAKEKSDETGADERLDPRLERAMADMEHEMASMDENNPDPRQLGRLMRKLVDATGKKMPGEMEQMLERLERGEDPEKLEEEFGDALDNLGEDAFGTGEEGEEASAARTLLRSRKARPSRDPKLYEMRDYL